MSSVYQPFPSIKEIHEIPDVQQGLTEIVEPEEETMPIQGEFVGGMFPPLPGKNFFLMLLIL